MKLANSAPSATAAFEIKGSSFTTIVFCLKDVSVIAIARQLEGLLTRTPDFFNDDPVVLDFASVQNVATPVDFRGISELLRRHRLIPVGICNGNPSQTNQALLHGFGLFSGFPAESQPAIPVASVAEEPVVLPAGPASEAPTTVAASNVRTVAKVVTKPVRTGQQIYAQGSDLIVLAPISTGAEVLADGNIHIYAPMRGRALAGVRGDASARIFCQSMEAELVSIAGCYRVIEDTLTPDLQGKPVQMYLNGERLIIEAL